MVIYLVAIFSSQWKFCYDRAEYCNFTVDSNFYVNVCCFLMKQKQQISGNNSHPVNDDVRSLQMRCHLNRLR